jgi:hypothetical protein
MRKWLLMSEEVDVTYRRAGFATTDDVVLDETSTTRTILRSGIHDGGVRGHVVRQKQGAKGQWADVNEVDFRKLPADAGVTIELSTDATRKFFERLEQLYRLHEHGIERRDQRYVVAPADRVLLVDDEQKAQAIRELVGSEEQSEEFWQALVEHNGSFASDLAAGKLQQDRAEAILAFRAGLADHPDDEAYWQDFFQRHPWMLQSAFSAAVFMLGGETYVGGKMPTGRQGVGGVATDFLLSDASTKSFAVVEIKTPATSLVGALYRGERDSGLDSETYSMHGDLSGGIVQTRNQIAVALDYFESVLGRGYEGLNRIHPKGVLVIGSGADLSERQMSSFNHFRQGQYSLTVITFDELLRRLSILYEVNIDEA